MAASHVRENALLHYCTHITKEMPYLSELRHRGRRLVDLSLISSLSVKNNKRKKLTNSCSEVAKRAFKKLSITYRVLCKILPPLYFYASQMP